MRSANQILADNLTRLMNERGLKYAQLGQLAGLAPNTIKNYCNPDREGSAKLSDLELLAQKLKVPLVSLLTEQEGSAFPSALTPVQLQLLADLDELPEQRQSSFLDLLHQEAETARAYVAHAESKKRRRAAPAPAPSAAPTTATALKSGYARTTIRARGADERQGTLPLVVSRNPFDPKSASPSERAWYEQLERTKVKK